MGGLLSWLRAKFWSRELDITILGLQNAGKSSFVRVLSTGKFDDSLKPTLGAQTHQVRKDNVSIKIWDVAGQKKFRKEHRRYIRMAQLIVYVVDSADARLFDESFTELRRILSYKDSLHVPVLILLNKTDLSTAVHPETVIKRMQLDEYLDGSRDIAYYAISCRNVQNVDKALAWIIKHSRSPGKKKKKNSQQSSRDERKSHSV